MNVSISVPESLKDITLKQYQKFLTIKDDNETFYRKKVVQIFCNVPLLVVDKMMRKDFISISSHILTLLTDRPELQPVIEFKEKRFGFIPNLEDNMTLGEYVDLDEYMKDWKDFHKAMNVLYRPIVSGKKKYIIEEYNDGEKYAMQMLDLPMDVVMGAVFFLINLSRQLLIITPSYLQNLLEKEPTTIAALEKNGVGISTLSNLLEVACSSLEELVPYTLGQRYIS